MLTENGSGRRGLMDCAKNKSGFNISSKYATPPKQRPKFVNETSRVNSLFNQHCIESIIRSIIIIIYCLHIFDIFFLKHDTNHSWRPCIN